MTSPVRARSAFRFPLVLAIIAAVALAAIVLAWLTGRQAYSNVASDDTTSPERRFSDREDGAEPRWIPRPRSQAWIQPSTDLSDRRNALEAELSTLQAEIRAKHLEFVKKARSLTEYDPLLCAHMDDPLCPPYAMSAAELDRLADCGGVKLDTPRFMWRDDEPLFDPRWETVELSPEERTRVEAALAEIRADLEEEARTVWVAETGDEADAAALDLAGLNSLLFMVQRPSAFDDALRYVSAELAGRPPVGSPPPHLVNYLNTMLRVGDRIESTLAEAIGATRASELRRAASGWGHTLLTSAGCPDDVGAFRRSREIEAELAELDRTGENVDVEND